jgi:hypothetical protein
MAEDTINDHNHDDCPDESPWSFRSLAPLLLATGSSVLLGYILGRGSYRKDLTEAIRTVESSPVPITVRIREVF